MEIKVVVNNEEIILEGKELETFLADQNEMKSAFDIEFAKMEAKKAKMETFFNSEAEQSTPIVIDETKTK
jgi:hypothetical protein